MHLRIHVALMSSLHRGQPVLNVIALLQTLCERSKMTDTTLNKRRYQPNTINVSLDKGISTSASTTININLNDYQRRQRWLSTSSQRQSNSDNNEYQRWLSEDQTATASLTIDVDLNDNQTATVPLTIDVNLNDNQTATASLIDVNLKDNQGQRQVQQKSRRS